MVLYILDLKTFCLNKYEYYLDVYVYVYVYESVWVDIVDNHFCNIINMHFLQITTALSQLDILIQFAIHHRSTLTITI